ncbi:MAG: pantetheine-phosphate adenylyltransferase [Nitrosopumilus sp.]|jgi:pantetheine-phosphate adenylyltransferase|nr:pantetheine-phosphate adenylyltransferase [Nitrosopumilus sp.]
MSEYSLVAMGGTFDIIHKGHLTLLSNAFAVSDKVIIGITSDELATKKGKILVNKYDQRFENLISVISKEFPNSSFQISKLENDFGPAVLEKEVEALIVSDETSTQGNILNQLRAEKKIPPIQIVIVPMFLAKDGVRISTTRIKNSEIDIDGNLLSIDK